MTDVTDFVPKLTADGTYTFFSAEYGELFKSDRVARQEALLKFIEPTQLPQKADLPRLRLLDICYGLGYNTAAALATIWKINPNCYVELIGLELNPTVPQAAIAHQCFQDWAGEYTGILTCLATEHQVETPQLKATLIIGDARVTIRLIQQRGYLADAIFLDPFSPPKCPQMWTVEFLAEVSRCLSQDGRIATYSCAAAVRTALMATGLQIGSTPPVGRRSPGTVASRATDDLPMLSGREQEHLLTRAAIPYRDPQLSDVTTVILQRRQQEQQESRLEPTANWRKRIR